MADILVYRMRDGWVAEFLRPDLRADCNGAFGCNTLPTPYKPAASATIVVAAIRKANPGATVAVGRF